MNIGFFASNEVGKEHIVTVDGNVPNVGDIVYIGTWKGDRKHPKKWRVERIDWSVRYHTNPLEIILKGMDDFLKPLYHAEVFLLEE